MSDTNEQPGAIKQIDPCALATLTTGIMMCESFSTVSEAAEWLLGHPVWTHEFIVPDIQQALTEAVLVQYPTIPTVRPDDWAALRAQLHADLGELVPVARGDRTRNAGPVKSLNKLRASFGGSPAEVREAVTWDRGGPYPPAGFYRLHLEDGGTIDRDMGPDWVWDDDTFRGGVRIAYAERLPDPRLNPSGDA